MKSLLLNGEKFFNGSFCFRGMENRLAFTRRQRKHNETIREYVNSLRALAADCGFENSLEERVRDQLIFGIGNANWQKELLNRHSTDGAKLQDVLDTAAELESASNRMEVGSLEGEIFFKKS